MKFAILNEERIEASPNIKGAKCEICNSEVIPKCGEIKIWHFAHITNIDCDSWYEPESEWHLNWKNQFPKEQQEVVMGKHRADIKNIKGIIELQNSSISAESINEREEYYKQMIWLLNAETLCNGLDLRKEKEIITFRWKNPPKSWWNAKKPIFIHLNNEQEEIEVKIQTDTGYNSYTETEYPIYEKIIIKNNLYEETKDKILLIKKIYHNIPCGGWGILLSKEQFLKQYME